MRKIKEIKLGCMSNFGGLKWYEVRHFYIHEDDGRETWGTIDIGFNVLKQMGVIKTFNSTKKLTEWLNGDEGRMWYVDRVNEQFAPYKRYCV